MTSIAVLALSNSSAAQTAPAPPVIEPEPRTGAITFDAELPHHITATRVPPDVTTWPAGEHEHACSTPCVLSLPPGRWRIYTRSESSRIGVHSEGIDPAPRSEAEERRGPTFHPSGDGIPELVREPGRLATRLYITGSVLGVTGGVACVVALATFVAAVRESLDRSPHGPRLSVAAEVSATVGLAAVASGAGFWGVGTLVRNTQYERRSSQPLRAEVRWAPTAGVSREGATVGAVVVF